MQKNDVIIPNKRTSESSKGSPPKQRVSFENLSEELLNSSAHFGDGANDDNFLTNNLNLDSTELRYQLTRSNEFTKKLASVLSTLVAKIKDLETQNNHLLLEKEEYKKQNAIKDRIILEKNAELAEKDRKIEEISDNSHRLEKEMIKNRSKISNAMNLAFDKGNSELVEFIERDILSVSSKPGP